MNVPLALWEWKGIEASVLQRNPQVRTIPRGGASLHFKD